MTKIEEFFARYEEGANSFEPDLLSSLYTEEFMGGDPNGVSCGRNDQSLRDAFGQRLNPQRSATPKNRYQVRRGAHL